MRGVVVSIVFMFCHFIVCLAQEDNLTEVIARVAGCADAEELDPDVVEHFVHLARRPLSINSAGAGQMESSGLFTSYQVAALLDYRERHGGVMSWSELAAVDGFSQSRVSDIRMFISLDGGSPQADRTSRRWIEGDVWARTGGKVEASMDFKTLDYMYSARAKVSLSGGFDLGFATTRGYAAGNSYPDSFTGNVRWKCSGGQVIAGDFNARIGQGLCLWNSVVMDSFSTPSSFMKRAGGLSPSNSFTGNYALSGVAADWSPGKWKITALLAVPGIKDVRSRPEKVRLQPALSVGRYMRFGHFSLNHTMSFSDLKSSAFRIPAMSSSGDFAFCLRGVNVYGELAFDWVDLRPSFVAGMESDVGEHLHLAALARYMPQANQYGASLGAEVRNRKHYLTVAADALYHPVSKSKDGSKSMQLKINAVWEWKCLTGLTLRMRLSERMRSLGTLFRTSLRNDLIYVNDRWHAAARIEVLHCVSLGLLTYLEGGWKSKGLSAYVRAGYFRTDDWEDRIYAYERDFAGCFNVPAYYGRGWWTAAYLSWKYSRWGTVQLRAAYKKPGKAELKIQSVLHF